MGLSRRRKAPPVLMEAIMNKTARESLPAEHAGNQRPESPADKRQGTREMPMPDNAPDVAGRPRQGRAIAEPGDPGVIAPEDDVLDTSQHSTPGR
jgi:hypothetical protein